MKFKKTTAVLLAASLMLSSTGCSNRKKAVLEAAQGYAEAVISGDIDDIAEFMEDDDEFEDAREAYLNKYSSQEDLEDIYEFILENMTYEIDKKSLGISEKKATVTVVYTVIDYMDIYEDGDEAEDLLDALEDETDNTFTIKQKIELKPDGDEWKVVDDDQEEILEVYAFYQEIYDLGFGKLRPLDHDTFEDALAAVFGNDGYDLDTMNERYGCRWEFWDDYTDYSLMEYDDIEDAQENFENAYNELTSLERSNEFSGDLEYSFENETGYILINGTLDYGYSSDHIYGGVYLSDNTVLTVIAFGGSSSDSANIDDFLDEIGYPHPQ